jgi:hypothetical protein
MKTGSRPHGSRVRRGAQMARHGSGTGNLPGNVGLNIRSAMMLSIGILIGFLVLESALRIFKFAFLPFVAKNHNPCIFVADEKTGFRFKPNSSGWVHRNFEMDNSVDINSIGFHDIEHKNIGHKQKTILAIGDSFTAGIHVPVSETWTQVLERELSETVVINLGLSATGTDAHLELLKEHVSTFRPDAVILAFCYNDVTDLEGKIRYLECYNGYVIHYDDQQQKEHIRAYVDAHSPNALSRWLFDNFFTFRAASRYLLPRGQLLLRNNWVSPSRIGLEVAKNHTARRTLDDLLIEFEQLSKQWGFKFFIVPIPSHEEPVSSMEVLQAATSPDLLARFELVDITSKWEALRVTRNESRHDLFWKFDGHFNASGNEVFGLAVAAMIEQDVEVDHSQGRGQ